MQFHFPTDYQIVLELIDRIDPVEYAQTRNYIDGAVTKLSPYISRGVISTNFVLNKVLEKGYDIRQIESFIKELCWRDYFQRVAQHKNLSTEIRFPQIPVSNYGIPAAVMDAYTGINSVDEAIRGLYDTGYMHNHCRMYTASMVCNLAQSHWLQPAQWMYYHLLDGDWASNACSWQWVAGANSSKKYYANQENINKYTHSRQANTFLDQSYEQLASMESPKALSVISQFIPAVRLPESGMRSIDPSRTTFIYNYYNLDPLWHVGEQGNRILLLEPEFFHQFPVSEKCVEFILALSKNIPDLQLYVGSFDSLVNNYHLNEVHYKEHPLNAGYRGIEESRDWIAPEITGYFSSFFGYWKVVERQRFSANHSFND